MFKNSNNDSFGIHSVKVLVQVHYFWTNLVASDPKIGGRGSDYEKSKFPTFIPNIELFTRFLTI